MKKVLLGALLAVAFTAPSFALNVGSPAQGATVAAHRVAIDQNGKQFFLAGELGYKVFESSNTTGVASLMDESSTTIKSCTVIHAMCIDDGAGAATAGYAVGFDTAAISGGTLSGLTLGSANSVTGQLWASATAQNCQTYDAQAQNGFAVIMSNANMAVHVYWRACAATAK